MWVRLPAFQDAVPAHFVLGLSDDAAMRVIYTAGPNPMNVALKSPRRRLSVTPSEQLARIALREAQVLMTPVVRWLLRHGVHYSAFADALKTVFVTVARQELAYGDSKVTDSSVSVLSGVHRKDVRTLGDAQDPPAALRSVPLASQVFTRWLTNARYCGAPGRPAVLPRLGPGASFESLAREVSTDVHPRTVLDELLRLGLVEIDGDSVRPQAQMFIPAKGLEDLDALFSANVADHIAAAVHNVTEPGPKLLEHSVFADGLTPQSALELADEARSLWARAFEGMVARAQRRVDADTNAGGSTRVRFGVYFYADPVPEAPAADAAEPARGR